MAELKAAYCTYWSPAEQRVKKVRNELNLAECTQNLEYFFFRCILSLVLNMFVECFNIIQLEWLLTSQQRRDFDIFHTLLRLLNAILYLHSWALVTCTPLCTRRNSFFYSLVNQNWQVKNFLSAYRSNWKFTIFRMWVKMQANMSEGGKNSKISYLNYMMKI